MRWLRKSASRNPAEIKIKAKEPSKDKKKADKAIWRESLFKLYEKKIGGRGTKEMIKIELIKWLLSMAKIIFKK